MTERAKWLKFDERGLTASGKTKLWDVCTLEGQLLGQIRWFGGWRKYSFFPGADTVFEQDCLRDIADFCQRESQAHHQRLLDKIHLRRTRRGLANC